MKRLLDIKCAATHVCSIMQQLKEGFKEAVRACAACLLTYNDWFWGKKEHPLLWRLPAGIIYSTVTETCFCKIVSVRKKRVALNSGLRSGIWICILMFPCPKSRRIDQAKQLLLCYSSGESQAIYFAAGLWGEVIILSRNMHWKAKSLHIAQQEKHSTVRGHHCCMQREAESSCCSWKIGCLLFPVGSRYSLCSVHPSVYSNGLHSSGKTSSKLCLSTTWQVPWGWQEITESEFFLSNLHLTWICLWCQ